MKKANNPKSIVGEQQQRKNLRAKCQEARKLLAAAERTDVVARYQVGVIVREAMDEGRYGKKAVGRMEKDLGRDQQTLYAYGVVALAWSAADFRAMTKEPNAKGIPLTWSHYEEIAAVKDGRARRGLVTRAQKKCLTVRQLREIIPASKPDGGKSASKVKSPVVAIGRLVRTLDTVKEKALAWQQKLGPSLIASRETLSEKEISGLRSAWDRMNETKVVLDRVSEMLREVLTPIAEPAPSRVVEAGPVAQAAAGT